MVDVLDARLLSLPRVSDPRGNLTFVESDRQIPFQLRRVFYLYDVPSGESRAGHAHRRLQEVIIAASGSFDVILDDARTKRTVTLRRSDQGLYVPGMLWRTLTGFSSGSVCLVLCSEFYDPGDYYRDLDEYATAVAAARC